MKERKLGERKKEEELVRSEGRKERKKEKKERKKERKKEKERGG